MPKFNKPQERPEVTGPIRTVSRLPDTLTF